MDAPAHRTRIVVTGDALAACLLLAVAMGFGRFAYTAMYPLMVRDGVVTIESGSLAASANYAGYLVGALAMGRARPADAAFLCRVGSTATVLCLAAMAPSAAPAWFYCIVRFLAGVASAVVLIGASVWLLQVVGLSEGAPLLFGGVGAGIAVSAEIVALGTKLHQHSSELWLVLTVTGAVLVGFAWSRFGSRAPGRAPSPAAGSSVAPKSELSPATLILAYGLAGFGYIVTATFLPLFVRTALGSVDPVHIWAVFGLAAAPSCFFWNAVHRRFGARRALAANLFCQAIGVVMPVFSHHPIALLLGSFLVGWTFLGTVTVALLAGRRAGDSQRFNIIAAMTAAYGVGQIVGPILTGVLHGRTGSFDTPLMVAGGALLVGGIACLVSRTREEPTLA